MKLNGTSITHVAEPRGFPGGRIKGQRKPRKGNGQGANSQVRLRKRALEGVGTCYLMIARTKLNAVQCHYATIIFQRNQVDLDLIIILKVGSVHG